MVDHHVIFLELSHPSNQNITSPRKPLIGPRTFRAKNTRRLTVAKIDFPPIFSPGEKTTSQKTQFADIFDLTTKF